MKPAAQPVRDRLRLEVIIERGEIAPARVAADFDHAGAEHDPKNERAKKPDARSSGGGAARERPAIEQRTKKDREETGLEQLHFPAVAIPILPDVNERHVEQPRAARAESRSRSRRARRRKERSRSRRSTTRAVSEWFNQKSEGSRRNPPNEPPSAARTWSRKLPTRQKSVGADERENLIRGDQKRDRVDEPEQAQNDETGQPIALAVGKDALPFLELHAEKSRAPAPMDSPGAEGRAASGGHLRGRRVHLEGSTRIHLKGSRCTSEVAASTSRGRPRLRRSASTSRGRRGHLRSGFAPQGRRGHLERSEAPRQLA